MKNYKVKATRVFTDGVENIVRYIDDEFECTKERYEILKGYNAVELIEIKKVEDAIIMPKIEIKINDEVIKESLKGLKVAKEIDDEINEALNKEIIKKVANKKTNNKKKSK